MQSLNILFLCSYYPPYSIGGAEQMVEEHIHGLIKRNHRISLVTLGPGKLISYENTNDGLNIYRVPIRNFYWPIGNQQGRLSKILWHLLDCYNPFHKRDLITVCQSVSPDIVICENITGWSPYVWYFFHHRNIPILQFSHDTSFLCAKGTMFQNHHDCGKQCFPCKLLTLGYRLNKKNLAAMVYVSKAHQKRFEKNGFVIRRSYVVHNTEAIQLVKKEHLWLPGKTMRIGLLANLSEWKGVFNLIKAFGLLKGNFTLTIGGNFVSENLEKEVKKRIHNDPRIKLLGRTTAHDFFSQIDLSVIPSLWNESFGLTAIESLVNQVPVVCSNFGGLTEIIKDGINGLWCNPYHPIDIAQAIQKVYDNFDFYKLMVMNAHSSVKPFIDSTKMAIDIEHICYDICKQ